MYLSGGWPFDLEPEINGWQKCKPDHGETVTIAVLKEVAAILIDIHGQRTSVFSYIKRFISGCSMHLRGIILQI